MNAFNTAIKNRWVKISFILFLITLLLFIFTPPHINALVYKAKIYPLIRTALNNTIGIFTFPAVFIVFSLMILGLIFIPVIQIVKKMYAKAIVYTVSYLMILVTIFFWIWGFHYNNPILVPQPDLERYPIQKATLLKTFDRALSLRERLGNDSISPSWQPPTIQRVEDSGRYWLESAIRLLGDKPTTASNAVRWWPEGFILRWGIVGMYFPFSGEATVDRGLHSIRYPSTTLHEWAHSMGYTNEGDCNLLAYLAAQNSSDPFIRYSAEVERLREEMYFTAMQNPALYDDVIKDLPPVIEKDLMDIRRFHAKYKGQMSDIGNWVNDQYLKTLSGDNGIDEYWLWVIKLHLIEEKSFITNSNQR